MATSVSDRRSTPPHHPTFQVSLTTACIDEIVTKCLPGARLQSVQQLESGKSYNNRIYYLDVGDLPLSKSQSSVADAQKLVLKLNGRFFGSEKVQNEVACLRLLETYSPSIPAPKVVAWSEDGRAITRRSALGTGTIGTSVSTESTKQGGWILMTRVPGQPINAAQLDKDQLPQVLSQLAEHVTNWRQKIPPQPFCGSLRFHGGDHSPNSASINLFDPVLGTYGLSIRGLVGENLFLDQPIESLEDYYRIRIIKKIEELQTKQDLERNRIILPSLKSFINNDLSRIEVISTQVENCTPSRPFLFTHYDLSPRNILVSGSPPRITGIIDFEFAGFFSQYEEFVNDRVNNDGDWSKEDYQIYCQELEQNGINTPNHGFDEVFWKHILQLEELIQNIAPWWLPGPHKGIALEQELQKSEELLRALLLTLSERTSQDSRKNG